MDLQELLIKIEQLDVSLSGEKIASQLQNSSGFELYPNTATVFLINDKLDLSRNKIQKLIKEETQATIRCIPLENNCVGNNRVKDSCVENTFVEGNCVDGKCIKTGKNSSIKVLFAQNY